MVFIHVVLAVSAFPLVIGFQQVIATCHLFHYESSKIIGEVKFLQQGSDVQLSGCIDNLPVGKHGFHVHQFGSIGSNCTEAGGHFNPENRLHGDIADNERHVGDLGNLEVTSESGFCLKPFSDNIISLLPGKHSIIGRVLAVHRDADDLGRGVFPESKKTGNSGPRIACCVIGLKSELPSIAPFHGLRLSLFMISFLSYLSRVF